MSALLMALVALLFASPAASQTRSLTLGNLKAPIARAAGTPEAKSIAELWLQINGLPAANHGHPVPAPPGWVISPTIDGVMPIASGLNVQNYLWKSWGTGDIAKSAAPDPEGAFRFLCAPSHNAYDDPIVYPGQPGKSHLHTFFGNTKADANSTYATLRTTGDSTCNTLLNRSAYWIAAMIRPPQPTDPAPKQDEKVAPKVVMPDYVSIYYKRPPQSSKLCKEPYARECRALPRDLRYIFGYNMIDPTKHDPARFRWFNCDGPGAVSGHFATIAEAAKGCPKGARLGAVIVGPNCWDGKHLDSPDHRSHMAYQEYDGNHAEPVCPKTHPILLPFFELGAWYTNDGTAAQWKLSSDIQMGTEAGVTFHADWYGAWEDSILDRWTANCIDRMLSCSGGDLGDGWQLATTSGYDYPRGRPLLPAPQKAANVISSALGSSDKDSRIK